MRYDASWSALFQPQTQPALDPALFTGKPEALGAELARLAYFDFTSQRDELAAGLAGHGLTLSRCIEGVALPAKTEVFTALDGHGTGYVAFRGTQSDGPWDLLTDMMALPVCWTPGMWVHHGFRRAYASVREELEQWLADSRPQRLIALGHSLGGALATLFAAEHVEAELHTIGSPAVGNGAFAAQFTGRKVQRFRQCCDIVPRIPPEWVVYRQLGHLHYVDHAGTLADAAPDPSAIKRDMAAGRRSFAADFPVGVSGVPLRSLADHSPINYVSALLGIREA